VFIPERSKPGDTTSGDLQFLAGIISFNCFGKYYGTILTGFPGNSLSFIPHTASSACELF